MTTNHRLMRMMAACVLASLSILLQSAPIGVAQTLARHHHHAARVTSRHLAGVTGRQGIGRHFRPLLDPNCPSGWTCSDIGNPPNAGTETLSNGTWMISGSGSGPGGTSDTLHYVSQSLAASGSISAHVASGAPFALVIRTSATDAQAPYYAVMWTQDVNSNWHVSVSYRFHEGYIARTLADTIASSGVYLRLVRSGVSYTASYSPNGTGWTQLQTAAMDLPGAVQIGMASWNPYGPLSTVTVDTVQVSPADQTPISAACPYGWDCSDVGGVATPGSQSTVGQGAWAIQGDGTGMSWNGIEYNGNDDQFRFISQPFTAGTISARQLWVDTTGTPYGDAGLMVRQSNTGGSAFYSIGIDLYQDGSTMGFRIQWRDGNGNTYASYPGSAPVGTYLELVDSGGGAFAAYSSSDGVSWTLVPGSQMTIPAWSGAGRAGLFATNGPANNSLGLAGFDNLSISRPGPSTPALLGDHPSVPWNGRNTQCPVNCDTGNFWHTFEDLSIPGRGVPLDFSHTYNSLSASQNGPLGYGWTDSYNMSLTTDGSGNYTVSQETGSSVTFSCGTTCSGPGWVLATLVHSGDGTYTFTRNDQTKYIFAAPTVSVPGQLLKEMDRNGYTTTLAYTNGQLSSITDSAGRAITVTWGGSTISRLADPAGRHVSFAYDGSGNLQSVTDVGGKLTTFTYDGGHHLLTMTYPRGGVVTNVYDSAGRVTQQTDPLSHTTTFVYAPSIGSEQTTTITDPNGNVSEELYGNNDLIMETDGAGTPQAATWTYGYDSATLGVTSVTDPNGHVWSASYDSKGNPLSSTDPLNRTTAYTYDSLNDLTSVTDPSNVKTTLGYDASGNLLSISRPLTSNGQTVTTTLRYGDSTHPGDVTGVVDPNSHTTTFAYDSNGDMTSVTDPLGNKTTASYDGIGRLLSTVSPKGNTPPANPSAFTTSFIYDAYGDVTSVTDPLGDKTSDVYDADGNLQTVTDALNHVTTYTYDLADQLTAVSLPDSTAAHESYAYAPNGNLTSQTDALGHTTSYTYDALNRVLSASDALNRTTRYGYDGVGNLTSVQNPLNQTASYSYDAANQLTGISFSDGVTHNASFTYTPDGLRQTMADGTGTTTYNYDSLNRLTSSQDGAGKTVSYGYDLVGNLTSLTYPDNTQVSRAYDAANELTSVKDWLSNTTSFGYDPNGNLTSETFPNGVTSSLGYDNADQLQNIVYSGSNTFRWTFGYGRDALGQVSAATDRLPGIRHTYGYDAFGRVTSDARSNRTSTTWGYDNADRLTSIADTAQNSSSTLGYDNADELTSLVTTTNGSQSQNLTFSYNANGDRTQSTDSVSNTTTTYGYNQLDRLTSFTKGSTSASYVYNGDGLRTSKTVNGTAESYVWDLAEGLPLILQDGSTKYVTGPDGLPVEQVDGSGTVSYYLQDQLGSTRGLTNASGQIVARYTYTPYGSLKGSSGSVSTPFQYAGQYTDAESGLQYLRARYYDPGTEQFLTPDPLRATTLEPYGYAGDGPLSSGDPSGLCPGGANPLGSGIRRPPDRPSADDAGGGFFWGGGGAGGGGGGEPDPVQEPPKVGSSPGAVAVEEDVAAEVSKALGGRLSRLAKGWQINVGYSKGRDIIIRIMQAGTGGRDQPYFKVSIQGKEAYDAQGRVVKDHSLSHTTIRDAATAVRQIIEIVAKILNERK